MDRRRMVGIGVLAVAAAAVTTLGAWQAGPGEAFPDDGLTRTVEVLPAQYDFTGDGAPETAEVLTVTAPDGTNAWYELQVVDAGGDVLWSQQAGLSHAGWASLFACRAEGRDCLLRYSPWVSMGSACYSYELFTLDASGEEQLLRSGSVSFFLPAGEWSLADLDPAVADFLTEVHRYLDAGDLLLTTENGDFRSGGPGADFRDDLALAGASAEPADTGWSFRGTVFTYQGKDYDLQDRSQAVNAIISCTPAGKYIVVEGHGGPKNAFYSIFNTATAEFEKDILGVSLIWRNNDLTTAVYACGAEIFTYDGVVLGRCDLGEDGYIYDLSFAEDAVRATVLHLDGSEEAEDFPLRGT